MFDKKFFLAWIAAFVAWFVGTYVVNVYLIDYSAIAGLMRPWEEELQRYPVLILADLILTGSFVRFYVRGLERKPWLPQGLGFGLAAALLSAVPMSMRYFDAEPVPVAMLVQQIVYFIALMMILGALVGFLYRDAPRAA